MPGEPRNPTRQDYASVLGQKILAKKCLKLGQELPERTCTWPNFSQSVRNSLAFFPQREKQVVENSHGSRFLGLGTEKGRSVVGSGSDAGQTRQTWVLTFAEIP